MDLMPTLKRRDFLASCMALAATSTVLPQVVIPPPLSPQMPVELSVLRFVSGAALDPTNAIHDGESLVFKAVQPPVTEWWVEAKLRLPDGNWRTVKSDSTQAHPAIHPSGSSLEFDYDLVVAAIDATEDDADQSVHGNTVFLV